MRFCPRQVIGLSRNVLQRHMLKCSLLERVSKIMTVSVILPYWIGIFRNVYWEVSSVTRKGERVCVCIHYPRYTA